MNQYGNLESSLAGHMMKTYVKSAIIALHLDSPAQHIRNAMNGRLHGAIGRGSPIWQSETSKCRARLAPYCTGCGVDLGLGGDPITLHAVRVDLPEPYSHVGTLPVQLNTTEN